MTNLLETTMNPVTRFAVLIGLLGLSEAYPNHAECRVVNTIPLGCAEAKQKILNQMTEWNTETECPGNCEKVSKRRGPPLVAVNYEGTNNPCTACPCGQKCLYKFAGQTENSIKGSHLTPVFKYEDAVTFDFADNSDGSCRVEGFSTALLSYAYFDFGTNYCNLRNLLDGAGLTGLPGFAEQTSEDVCMQLDRINCAKY